MEDIIIYAIAFLAFLAALWVYNDAKKRGLSGTPATLWAFAVFVFLIVFLPAYLIFRPKHPV